MCRPGAATVHVAEVFGPSVAASTVVQARQRRAATGTVSRHSGQVLVAGTAAGAFLRVAAPTSLTITMKITKATITKSTTVPRKSPTRKWSDETSHLRQSPWGTSAL